MAAATTDLEPAEARWVEQQVLADERARTPGQLAYRARKAALLIGARTVERRQAAAAESTLTAWQYAARVDYVWSLPLADAAVVQTYLETTAASEGRDDVRHAATRRADALLGLVRATLDAGVLPSGGDGRRPHLEVVATHESLLDGVWRGGEIEGRSVFGAQLRQLGCDADVRVTLIDDFGAILDQGRTTRVLSTAMRARLDVRDQHCRFVGCEARARVCRAHHIRHWADGGATDLLNLVLVCERHHHAVHDGGWEITLLGDASVVWISPAGHEVRVRAELDTLPELDPLTRPACPDPELDHPDGDWIRPWRELMREADPLPPDPSAPLPGPVPAPTDIPEVCPF